jgi:hypothetical protein
MPKKIEGVKHQPALTARGEFGLKFREVGPAFLDNNHFAIDDCLPRNIEAPAMIENCFVQSSPFRV